MEIFGLPGYIVFLDFVISAQFYLIYYLYTRLKKIECEITQVENNKRKAYVIDPEYLKGLEIRLRDLERQLSNKEDKNHVTYVTQQPAVCCALREIFKERQKKQEDDKHV